MVHTPDFFPNCRDTSLGSNPRWNFCNELLKSEIKIHPLASKKKELKEPRDEDVLWMNVHFLSSTLAESGERICTFHRRKSPSVNTGFHAKSGAYSSRTIFPWRFFVGRLKDRDVHSLKTRAGTVTRGCAFRSSQGQAAFRRSETWKECVSSAGRSDPGAGGSKAWPMGMRIGSTNRAVWAREGTTTIDTILNDMFRARSAVRGIGATTAH